SERTFSKSVASAATSSCELANLAIDFTRTSSMSNSAIRLWEKTLLALMTLALCASRSHAVDLNDFIISYWCGPPSGGNYDEQYAEVAECNFTHAMYPVNGGSPEQNKAILEACEKHGLKYIPYDGRVLGKSPGDPQF